MDMDMDMDMDIWIWIWIMAPNSIIFLTFSLIKDFNFSYQTFNEQVNFFFNLRIGFYFNWNNQYFL